MAVPATRNYRLNSALTYDGSTWNFTGLKGVFGDSDLAGSLRISMPDDRLKLVADLRTNTLDIVDAGRSSATIPNGLKSWADPARCNKVNGHPRILPDATLRIDAISHFDADLHYRVARVRAESLPLSDIDLTLGLDHSLLTMRPFKANLAGGTLTANIALNARQPVVLTNYDIRLSPTPTGRLLARFGAEASGTTGTLSARAQMSGRGDSLRQSLASANGRIVFIMPQGTFWTRNIQLSELDIGTFIQKLFEKKLKEPVAINCGLIAFTVRNGIAAADPILIDTKKNVILGRGGFSFKSEAIDMAIRADGKTFSLFSGQSPVGVGGYFAAPNINPISGELLTRSGAGIGSASRPRRSPDCLPSSTRVMRNRPLADRFWRARELQHSAPPRANRATMSVRARPRRAKAASSRSPPRTASARSSSGSSRPRTSVVARERLDHILEPRRIAERQHMPVRSGVERLAVPVAHRPAGAFDHGDQRREIVKLEAGLAHHVDLTQREHRIIVAVAAHHHPAVVGPGGQAP